MAMSDRPAERHREIGRVFTHRVQGTRSWDVPSPVAEWTARDVVRHLTAWFPSFLAAGSGIQLPPDRASTKTRSARGRHSATPCRCCSTTRRPPTWS